MNFFQRAIRYLTRKPTKSILLMITFFVIGNLVILGMGVSQASDNAKILTRKKMRAIVSYEVDYNSYWNYVYSISDKDEMEAASRNSPKIPMDQVLLLKKDERVKALNYLLNNTFYSMGFENVPIGNEDMSSSDSSNQPYNAAGNSTRSNIMGYGNAFPELIELTEGTMTIKDGRFYSQDDIDQNRRVCVISEELAEQNALKPGDSLTMSTFSPDEKKTYIDAGISEDDVNLELEIIGIYNTKENVDPNSPDFKWMSPYESPKNRIYMPLSTLQEFVGTMTEYTVKVHPDWYRDTDVETVKTSRISPSRAVYLLDDPLNVDAFVEDHKSSTGDYLVLNANNETFKKMARPLDTMSFFANIVVWIVVVNAVVIISLVTALTLKTREYEIGVMLSIGVSKQMVVVQLFLELMLIAILGFAMASVSGSLAAGQVGEMVLDFQTTSEAQYGSSDEGSNYFSSSDYFTQVTQDEMLSEYHVSVSPMLIGEIFLLGTGVVLIATLIPSLMIMRLNPKQILLS